MSFLKQKLRLWFLVGTIITTISACGGSDSQNNNRYLDESGTLQNMTAIENLLIDQFAFFADDSFISDSKRVDLEWLDIWVTDENNNIILCANAVTDFDSIKVRNIYYGNLNDVFSNKRLSSNYQNDLFKIRLFSHYQGDSYCEISQEKVEIGGGFLKDGELVSKTIFLGETPVVNFERLITEPLMATNGRFYIRLKNDAAQKNPLPQSFSTSLAQDRIFIDQVYLADHGTTYRHDEEEPVEEAEADDDDSITLIDPEDLDTRSYFSPFFVSRPLVILVDVETGYPLATSSIFEGLNPVNNYDISYGQLYAGFEGADTRPVSLAEISQKEVYFLVLQSWQDRKFFDQAVFDEDGQLNGINGDTIARYDHFLGMSEKAVLADLLNQRIEILRDGESNGYISLTYAD